MKPVPFPATIDEPPILLLWRVDDIVVPVLCLFIGLLLHKIAVFFSLGLGLMYVYRRFRDGKPEFFVLHALYWSGVYPARGLGFVNPYLRRLLP
jgi:conjugal transfer pilus assembly protein TraL